MMRKTSRHICNYDILNDIEKETESVETNSKMMSETHAVKLL